MNVLVLNVGSSTVKFPGALSDGARFVSLTTMSTVCVSLKVGDPESSTFTSKT